MGVAVRCLVVGGRNSRSRVGKRKVKGLGKVYGVVGSIKDTQDKRLPRVHDRGLARICKMSQIGMHIFIMPISHI